MAQLPFPAYCLHRATDRAFCTVRVAGKRKVTYFGPFGSEPGLAKYADLLRSMHLSDTLVTQAVATARESVKGHTPAAKPVTEPAGVTVQALFNAHQHWAPTHYRLPSGEVSREVANFRDSFTDCLALLGSHPVSELTRADLVAVRQRMIDRKLSRKVINQRVGRIVRVFVWGGDEDRGLVPDSVAAAFSLVKPLKPFRSEAPEKEPVEPVPPDDLQKVIDVSPPVLKAMLTLQLLTGFRPGDIRGLKKGMVKEEDGKWVIDFRLAHKMGYKGKRKVVPIGPQAVQLLKEWLEKASDEQHLFRPEFAPKSVGRKRLPHYTKGAYTRAVWYACHRAKVPVFGPNRIRHLAATEIRRQFGLEAAQAVLGHAHFSTTERYASPVSELASKVAEKRG